jgi:hypothetical protein
VTRGLLSCAVVRIIFTMVRERGWSLPLAGLSDPWRAASSRHGHGQRLSTHTTTENTYWPSPYQPALDKFDIDIDM